MLTVVKQAERSDGAALFPGLADHDGGDYTLTVFLSIDRQDDRCDADGRLNPETMPSFRDDYCIEASREDGVWRLRVLPWTGRHHENMTGPAVVDLTDQRKGLDPLGLLRALLSGRHDGRGRAKGAVINGIACDPATATRIYTSTAGDNCFAIDGFRRFDEELYQNHDGYWFLVRPLAPDEAQEWLEDERHDHVLARQLFPAED
jgi:hypothetical protein